MTPILTLITVFACLGTTFALHCLSCQDEMGNPSTTCSGDIELIVTECSTETPVCGMYYYKDVKGQTMETGCVPLDFCSLKMPTTTDYIDHNCRTCYGVDICNSRFLKPQGLTPIGSTVSTVGVSSPVSSTEPPVSSPSSSGTVPVGQEKLPEVPKEVTTAGISTASVASNTQSSTVSATPSQVPNQAAGPISTVKPHHSKPNSASGVFYSSSLAIAMISATLFYQRKF